MTKELRQRQQRKFNEDEKRSAAKDEPMGSVAAAVPRDAGSAINSDDNCKNGNPAPPHEGGEATLVSGSEAHKADKPAKRKPRKTRRP